MPVAQMEQVIEHVEETEQAVRMTFTVSAELHDRLMYESEVSHRTPDELLDAALDRYLEDEEDYREASRVLAEVEAGRMKVIPWEEVERKLDALNAMEG